MKLPGTMAEKTISLWNRLISPSLLFITVMLCFPAYLFQDNIWVLWGEMVFFLLLALTKRGKIRVLTGFFIILGVTFFSLFSPYGKVLFYVGHFSVTEGALETGLHRGISLTGMVFLSQLAVSPKLRLPGKIGTFMATMFWYLEALGKESLALKKGHILTAIDYRLYEVYWEEKEEVPSSVVTETQPIFSFSGIIFSLLLLSVLYFLLFYPILQKNL